MSSGPVRDPNYIPSANQRHLNPHSLEELELSDGKAIDFEPSEMLEFTRYIQRYSGGGMIDVVGRAVELAGSIEYQDDAVVSKEIIKKNTGTVTVFAFDRGQGLSEHTAPFDALAYIIDGKAEIVISGKPSIVQTGQIIIMPANKPHALKAIERFKMMLVMIKA